MVGSVVRKPQGLCAPHIAQINLLGRFPGGTQSLTAETLLSLNSREKETERDRERQGESDQGEEGGGKGGGGVEGLGIKSFLPG